MMHEYAGQEEQASEGTRMLDTERSIQETKEHNSETTENKRVLHEENSPVVDEAHEEAKHGLNEGSMAEDGSNISNLDDDECDMSENRAQAEEPKKVANDENVP